MASTFIDHEAEEDSEEEQQLPAKKKKKMALSSDEEDDGPEDDDTIREEMKGFVVEGDEEQEDEGQEGHEVKSSKSDLESESEDSLGDLEEDDYGVVEEALGVKLNKKKTRRVQLGSESEGEGEDEDNAERDARLRLERQLFDEDNEHDERRRPEKPRREVEREEYSEQEGSSEEESDADDFIVDDEGAAISKRKQKSRKPRGVGVSDSALAEAQDIFGIDFEFDEFLGEEEEENEEEEGGEEEGEGEEARPRVKPRKKTTKTTLLEEIEPAELERGFLSTVDKEIQFTDKPERFQIRTIPVSPADDKEIDEEANWIFKYAFCTLPISMQEDEADSSGKSAGAVSKIKDALNFMRNSDFEVPFIAFYRKEYVEPELNISDLWKVYHWDEKWCRLKSRKQNLQGLLQRIREFQFALVMEDTSQPLPDEMFPLEDEVFETLKKAETFEELQDLHAYFNIYWSRDLPRLEQFERMKKAAENGEEQPTEEDLALDAKLKQPSKRDAFSLCMSSGLGGFANKFGLTPRQFAENFRDGYARYEVEQYPVEPLEVAKDFICPQFPHPEAVMKGATYMVAIQLSREPYVRQVVRNDLQQRAKVCSRPTLKGRKEIDENHPVYSKKYLKNKPVKDLEKDEFLKLTQAVDNGLITMSLNMDSVDEPAPTYFEELLAKQFYHRDEYSTNVQDWNNLRSEALQICLEKFLYPVLIKELRLKLLQEARDSVIKECCLKLYNWLKIGPYVVDQQEDDEPFNGTRVLGIAYSPDNNEAAFAVLVDGNGEMTDYLKLPNLSKRRNRAEDKRLREADLDSLKQFVVNRRPHAVALAGENRDAVFLKKDIEELLQELEAEGNIGRQPAVELIENELSKVYSNSKRAQQDFRDFPLLLRQAVSIARRLQDPLVEFCQLCTPDEELLCLNFHALCDQIPKEELIEALSLEFINRVNEVGVDINRCLEHPHSATLLQFVCGLGPRKAAHLLKVLKQVDNLLESRTKLVTTCGMGPKVFMNCAGFIKIDTTRITERTEAYIELLDGSRVHPETYEWARKMAVDALEWAEDDEANPAGALEEILESPDKLKDLDLDAFATELERQGFGNKSITLYDIRAELNHRYKDLRAPYHSPSTEEIFNTCTKETPQTFNVGKLVLGRVIRIKRKALPQEQDQNPERNERTQLWQCPYCKRPNFQELSHVWSHVDLKECPGEAIGVEVRLENGLNGTIFNRNLSDKPVENPEDRVQDLYYDFKAEEDDRRNDEESKKVQQRQAYIKRVIAHPSFFNVSFKEAEKLLSVKDPGEVIIRPSSKGADHLTLTWKVAPDIYQHIDIREEGKENVFSLGRSLWIGDEEFEDLDEIIARHVQPMASYARELFAYKYYLDMGDVDRDMRPKIEAKLNEQKRLTPSRIPYFVTAPKGYAGRFLLSYLPRRARHEFVTVTPDGYRYRGNVFRTLALLISWFKKHFNDPIPGVASATPLTATPSEHRHPVGGNQNYRNPMYNSASVNTGPSNVNLWDMSNRQMSGSEQQPIRPLMQAAASYQNPNWNDGPGPSGSSFDRNRFYPGSTPSASAAQFRTPFSESGGGGGYPIHDSFAVPQQPMRPRMTRPSPRASGDWAETARQWAGRGGGGGGRGGGRGVFGQRIPQQSPRYSQSPRYQQQSPRYQQSPRFVNQSPRW